MRFTACLVAAAIAIPGAAWSAEFDAVFAGFRPDAPGCAVGAKTAGKDAVFGAYGSADLEHAVPITSQTVFEAGSVSKQFTAAAILLLAEQGKLSLSDDIRIYLPEMPDYGRPITVDMLLSHTSGLRDWGEVMNLAGWPRTSRIYALPDVLMIAARQKALNYSPGEAYSYTNTGFNLAAWIVARVSGQSLAEFTRTGIFEPLGMSRTAWRDDFRRITPGRAIAYAPAGGGFAQDMPFEDTYGHGALLTTVGDLLIWNDALTRGRLGANVSRRLQEQAVLTNGRKIAYARGLFVQEWQGEREVSHAGATASYRAWLGRYPDRNLSIALLCNTSGVNPVAVGRQVAAKYMPLRPVRSAPPAPAAEELAKRPGLYVDERTGAILDVAAKGGRLLASGLGGLAPQGGSLYRAAGFEVQFTDEGLVRRGPEGDETVFRRVERWDPSPQDLAELTGTYGSSEAGATLIANMRDGALILTPSDRPSRVQRVQPLYRDAFRIDDYLLRVLRGPDGGVAALRFTGSRVYSLDFQRIAAR